MHLIIHKTSVSPPARSTLMVANILGLNVETREVNLATKDQFKPEYLVKNPLHTVPLMEDGDIVLADSHVINTYLVSAYGNDEQKKLYPIDIAARARVDQRLYFDATILFPRLKTIVYWIVKKRIGITAEQMNDVLEAYSVTEKYLEEIAFVASDVLTLADISCVSTLSSLNCVVPINCQFEKLHAWWNRLKQETWYIKENEPGLKLFNNFIKQFL